MNRIDGMPTEFEWKIFTGITTLGVLKIQSLMRVLQCEPEHFTDRIIFMSVSNDIAWGEKGNTERCEYNSQTVAECARLDQRRNCAELTLTNQTDPGTKLQRTCMMKNFSDSGHPIFLASSAF